MAYLGFPQESPFPAPATAKGNPARLKKPYADASAALRAVDRSAPKQQREARRVYVCLVLGAQQARDAFFAALSGQEVLPPSEEHAAPSEEHAAQGKFVVVRSRSIFALTRVQSIDADLAFARMRARSF